MTSSWLTRYPDLAGKAAIVAGDGEVLVEIVRALASNQVLVAIVSTDRDLVTDATAAAEAAGVAVFGMTTDPASAAVWDRITQHIEQRLGPIDIAVGVGPATVRDAMRLALTPDMRARRRGVFIEVADGIAAEDLGEGVRHRCIRTDGWPDPETAGFVLAAASDTTTAPAVDYPV